MLCPKCPNCNNEILNDDRNDDENINEKNNKNNDNGQESFEESSNNEKNTNVTKTIKIRKKDFQKKKNGGDTSTQNEILVKGNYLTIGIKNNEGSSKRNMIIQKNKKKK